MFSFVVSTKTTPTRIVKKGERNLKIICVDDHKIFLSRMTKQIKDVMPEAEVVGFDNTDEAVAFAGAVGCDVLFTEIELYGKPSGLELARKIQELNSRVNIIFATVCSEKEYAEEVMRLRPSAYLTKVVTRQDIRQALEQLLYSAT